MTPLKTKLGPMPRNSSAPHFIDANNILPKNLSTPGFIRQISNRERTNSQMSREDSHVLFGIEVGSNTQLSNTQLYLAPSNGNVSRSRRGIDIFRIWVYKSLLIFGFQGSLNFKDCRKFSRNP